MNFDEWFSNEFLNCDLKDVDDRSYWDDVVSYAKPAWDYQQARIDAIEKLVNKYCLDFNDKTPASEILCQIARILEDDTTTN